MPDVTEAAAPAARPADLRALRIGLVSVVTLVAFESLAVITILPDIEDDLGGIAWYGWVTTSFFLGTMIGIVYAGDQADRRGAGRPYVGGLVLFAIGLLVGGLAPSMPVLVLGRFVQGFGAGVVPAIGYVAIGRAFSVEARPRMFAILSTAWVVPGLVGPVLAERVAGSVGWRWVFLGLLPLVAVAGSLVVPAMMRLGPVDGAGADDDGRSRRRMLDAVRVAAGAALIVASFTWSRWLLVPGTAAGLVVGAAPADPPDAARHAAGPPRPAGRDRLARPADVRVLRHRHVRPLRPDRRAGHLDVRRQHRRHRRDGRVDGRDVDPGPLDRPHRRGAGSCAPASCCSRRGSPSSPSRPSPTCCRSG